MQRDITSSNRPAAASTPPEFDPSRWPPLGGLTPFTTIDFPGRLAAVLYTQGCPWRCLYCHNSHLWSFAQATVSWERVRSFLEGRRGLLDGVVFSGGEPTAHEELAEAMRWVKSLGFAVALHTTGMFPDRLAAVLGHCDWVGMDVKAPFGDYARVTRTPSSGERARESARRLIASGVPHEFRTTRHSALLAETDLEALAHELASMGARRYALQSFSRAGCSDERLAALPDEPASGRIRKILKGLFDDFIVREN